MRTDALIHKVLVIMLSILLGSLFSGIIVVSAQTHAPTAFCDTVTEIPQTECEALVALYNSTNGTNWSNNTSWLQTNTPCNWYGVTCEGGNVTEITLYYNQLEGIIPNKISDISSLKILSLNGNQLSGKVITELGYLNNLQSLYLDGNQLTGTIPSELGNLSNLQVLSLQFNQLSGSIPPELGNLANLQDLYLGGNQISGTIPPDLGNLSSLRH